MNQLLLNPTLIMIVIFGLGVAEAAYFRIRFLRLRQVRFTNRHLTWVIILTSMVISLPAVMLGFGGFEYRLVATIVGIIAIGIMTVEFVRFLSQKQRWIGAAAIAGIVIVLIFTIPATIRMSATRTIGNQAYNIGASVIRFITNTAVNTEEPIMVQASVMPEINLDLSVPETCSLTVTSLGNLNLRVEPSMDAQVAEKLITDKIVEAVGTTAAKDWIQIDRQGTLVWASAQFLDDRDGNDQDCEDALPVTW